MKPVICIIYSVLILCTLSVSVVAVTDTHIETVGDNSYVHLQSYLGPSY
jgi:hypothetical protein